MGVREMTAAELATEMLAKRLELKGLAQFGSWCDRRARAIVGEAMERKAEKRAARSEAARASARARWKKEDANGMRTQCERNANAVRTQCERMANASGGEGSPRSPLPGFACGAAGAEGRAEAGAGERVAGAGAAEVASSSLAFNHSVRQEGAGKFERLREHGERVLAGSGLAWEDVALSAEVSGFGEEMLKNWLDQHAKHGWRVAGGKGPKLTKYDLTKNMGAWMGGQRGRDAAIAAASRSRTEGAAQEGREDRRRRLGLSRVPMVSVFKKSGE